AVVIANLVSNVDAGISDGVSITAGRHLTVSAATTETSYGAAFAGQVGGVTLSGQIVLITSDATQFAHIDDGAEVPHAGGTVTARADADRSVDTLAIGGSIAGVAAGAAIAKSILRGDTVAF